MHSATGATNPTNNGNFNADGTKKRVLPPPRKYCEVCEGIIASHFELNTINQRKKNRFKLIKSKKFGLVTVFDHEVGECDAEETY